MTHRPTDFSLSDRSIATLMDTRMQRRQCLAALAVPLIDPRVVRGSEILNVSDEWLQGLRLPNTGIEIDFPPVADNSAAVALTARIRATTPEPLEVIEVFLPANPHTKVLQIRLARPQRVFRFATRVRLAASQNLWVVGTFSDGSRHAAFAPTEVTSSSCYDVS